MLTIYKQFCDCGVGDWEKKRQRFIDYIALTKVHRQYIDSIDMSKGIDSLRDHYQQIRTRAHNNEMKKVSYKDVKKYKQEAVKEIDRMQNSGVFDNLEEADFYRDKFAQLETAMEVASKNKLSMKDFTLQSQQMFKEKGFASRNSYLSQPPVDPRVTSEPAVQNRMLQSFFQQKRSRLMPDVGFRSLLQNPPISPKNFKKKIGANNDQIARLKNQNQQLRKQLQSNRGMSNNPNLEVQIRKQQQRIRYLQSQNDRLSRDNTKLKSEKSVTVYTTQQPSYEDYLYSPYIINPRENDLLKIGMRSSDVDTNSYYNQNFGYGDQYNNNRMVGNEMNQHNLPSFGSKGDDVIYQRNLQTMSEMGDNNKKQHYSVFDMSKSRYSDHEGMDENYYKSSGSSGVDDPRTAIRNKIAFFRSSGMLVREDDLQIAYKRSEASNLASNRVILYFNNKSNKPKRVNIHYSFESQYYIINTTEKANQIPPLKQARQVVEVSLRGQKSDINSLIQAYITIDNQEYRLWLPVMFVKFTNSRDRIMDSMANKTKTIYLSKIFSNQTEAQKIIPELSTTGRKQGYLWGLSAVNEGPIKLVWKNDNKMQVTTSEKWIDFVSFLMFEYR